jgi:AraC-like DNA-binding protein
MSEVYQEMLQTFQNFGITFSFYTTPGGYHPLHWHDELELLYTLNGNADITIENKKSKLLSKHLVVVESCQVHSTFAHRTSCMYLCIHLSKKYMQRYIPDIELYKIHCIPEEIADENFRYYREICQMLENITRSYIEGAPTFQMEAEGLILQILARLIQHFSVNTAPQLTATDTISRERIRQVITYVQEHYREFVTLDDICAELGLGREYFCRFFKKHMGISFLSFLNEVRLTHCYEALLNTDLTISEIMEQNGITNQKHFNQTFKQLYGCTPSAVRNHKSSSR